MLDRMYKPGAISVAVDTCANGALLGASWLVGCGVYDDEGRVVGKLEEIIIDARTGCIRHAVLGIGGLLGIGRTRLAISWTALTADAENRRCLVDLTLMHLTALPFSKGPGVQRRFGSRSGRAEGSLAPDATIRPVALLGRGVPNRNQIA